MPAYVDLRAGQHISVLRGASGLGASYTSTIRHIAPVSMRIDIPRNDGERELALARSDEMTIMVDLQGRLFTFVSRVQQVDRASESLLIDRPSMVQQNERRQWFRLPVNIRPKYAAIVDAKGVEQRRLDAIMLDISGGGTQLRAKQPAQVGDRIHLVFPLDGEEFEADVLVLTTSLVEARAPWVHRANGRFLRLPRQLQEYIVHYIFREQIAQLKRGVR